MSLLPRVSEKRRSSFELLALKQYSKMSPQVGSAVNNYSQITGQNLLSLINSLIINSLFINEFFH